VAQEPRKLSGFEIRTVNAGCELTSSPLITDEIATWSAVAKAGGIKAE